MIHSSFKEKKCWTCWFVVQILHCWQWKEKKSLLTQINFDNFSQGWWPFLQWYSGSMVFGYFMLWIFSRKTTVWVTRFGEYVRENSTIRNWLSELFVDWCKGSYCWGKMKIIFFFLIELMQISLWIQIVFL